MAELGKCQRAEHIGLHEKIDSCINWWLPLTEQESLRQLLAIIYKR